MRGKYWVEDPRLTELTRTLYRERSGSPFLGQVYYNPRFGARTGGRAHPGRRPDRLEEAVILVNPRYVAASPDPNRTLQDLLLHELAHYHLYALGIVAHDHRHPLFLALMAEWGFSRYSDGEVLQTLKSPPRYLYRCPSGHEYPRQRPFRNRVSCGVCARGFNPAFLLRQVKRM